MLTLFIVNRHTTDEAVLDVSLTGFAGPELAEHFAMQGYRLEETNGPDRQDHVQPSQGRGVGVEDGKLKGKIGALSYHVLRLNVR
jgi:alpha-N-arabinofuranosidase